MHALFPPESECERAASELPILKRRIAGVVARAMMLVSEDPYQDWLGPWLDRADPCCYAHTGQPLSYAGCANPSSAAVHLWPIWMKAYLERRVSGFPLALHPCEVRWLFDWVAYVPQEEFDEAISLLERAPPSAPPDRWFIRPLFDSGLLDTNPDASASSDHTRIGIGGIDRKRSRCCSTNCKACSTLVAAACRCLVAFWRCYGRRH